MRKQFSVQCIKAIWDILKKLEKIGKLPKKHNIDALLNGSAIAVINCGEAIAKNNALWYSLPTVIETSIAGNVIKIRKSRLRESLQKLVSECT